MIYRRDIYGFRAIAVLTIIAFHTRINVFAKFVTNRFSKILQE